MRAAAVTLVIFNVFMAGAWTTQWIHTAQFHGGMLATLAALACGVVLLRMTRS